MKKSLLLYCFILAVLVEMLRKLKKTPPNLKKRKSFFAFNQSAYNKQWFGGGT
jgi:hypothetical protein